MNLIELVATLFCVAVPALLVVVVLDQHSGASNA
jgi:hypothetical protein